MTEGDAVVEGVTETTVFLSYFKDLPDCRQKGKVAYPLEEAILLMLAAALAGAETVADMTRFGRAKLKFLQRFQLFDNGTPSHDQLGIILARLDPIASAPLRVRQRQLRFPARTASCPRACPSPRGSARRSEPCRRPSRR